MMMMLLRIRVLIVSERIALVLVSHSLLWMFPSSPPHSHQIENFLDEKLFSLLTSIMLIKMMNVFRLTDAKKQEREREKEREKRKEKIY